MRLQRCSSTLLNLFTNSSFGFVCHGVILVMVRGQQAIQPGGVSGTPIYARRWHFLCAWICFPLQRVPNDAFTGFHHYNHKVTLTLRVTGQNRHSAGGACPRWQGFCNQYLKLLGREPKPQGTQGSAAAAGKQGSKSGMGQRDYIEVQQPGSHTEPKPQPHRRGSN